VADCAKPIGVSSTDRQFYPASGSVEQSAAFAGNASNHRLEALREFKPAVSAQKSLLATTANWQCARDFDGWIAWMRANDQPLAETVVPPGVLIATRVLAC
jgi:hypothetical protein